MITLHKSKWLHRLSKFKFNDTQKRRLSAVVVETTAEITITFNSSSWVPASHRKSAQKQQESSHHSDSVQTCNFNYVVQYDLNSSLYNVPNPFSLPNKYHHHVFFKLILILPSKV